MKQNKAAKAPEMTPADFIAEQDALMGGGPAMSPTNQAIAAPFAEQVLSRSRSIADQLDLQEQGQLPPEYLMPDVVDDWLAMGLTPEVRQRLNALKAARTQAGVAELGGMVAANPQSAQPLSAFPAGANPAAFGRPQF